jgi:hypothetical protein
LEKSNNIIRADNAKSALKGLGKVKIGMKYGLPVIFAVPDILDIADEFEDLH